MRPAAKSASGQIASGTGGSLGWIAGTLAPIVEQPAALFAQPFIAARANLFLATTLLLVVIGTVLQAPTLDALMSASVSAPGHAWYGLVVTVFMTVARVVTAAFGVALLFGLVLVWRIAGRLAGDIERYWYAVCAIGCVSVGMPAVISGAIIAIAGPQHVTSAADFARALPSLAYLFPNAPARALRLLTLVDPFKCWSMYLFAVAFSTIGGARRRFAWLGAFVVVFAPQLVCALFA